MPATNSNLISINIQQVRVVFNFHKVLSHLFLSRAYKMLHHETEPEALKNLHFLDKNDQTLYDFICGPSSTKLLLYSVQLQCTLYGIQCTVYNVHCTVEVTL